MKKKKRKKAKETQAQLRSKKCTQEERFRMFFGNVDTSESGDSLNILDFLNSLNPKIPPIELS